MKTLKNKLALVFILTATVLMPFQALAADPCADTTNKSGNVSQTQLQKCVTQNPITKEINTIVNFLSIGVGLVVILMIIMGGVQYITAGDNPEGVKAARQRISNALIALIVFIFMFSLLQWLIPGGLFNK